MKSITQADICQYHESFRRTNESLLKTELYSASQSRNNISNLFPNFFSIQLRKIDRPKHFMATLTEDFFLCSRVNKIQISNQNTIRIFSTTPRKSELTKLTFSHAIRLSCSLAQLICQICRYKFTPK